MIEQNTITNNMEKIKTLFQDSYNFASSNKNIDSYIQTIENVNDKFSSVCFEALAMYFAEKDILEQSFQLSNWRNFVGKNSPQYIIQMHVGLGWALAKSNVDIDNYLEKIEPFFVSRVIDGIGYYDGIFRHRKSIKSQKTSEKINSTLLKYYDLGLGRSIWYSSNGNILKVKEVIGLFSSERKENLWKGIGIASTFVGGMADNTLNTIFENAKEYQSHLLVGVLLAIKSRVQSNKVNDDTNKTCKMFFNSTPLDLDDRMNKMLLQVENDFDLFILEIEKHLIPQEVK